MPENTSQLRLPKPDAAMTPAERAAYSRLVVGDRWARAYAAKAAAAAARAEKARAEYARIRAAGGAA